MEHSATLNIPTDSALISEEKYYKAKHVFQFFKGITEKQGVLGDLPAFVKRIVADQTHSKSLSGYILALSGNQSIYSNGRETQAENASLKLEEQ